MGGYSTPRAMDRRIFAMFKHNKYPLLCFNFAKFLISVPPPLVSHARGQKSSFFDLPQSNSEAPNDPPTISLHHRLSKCASTVTSDTSLLTRTYFAIALLRAEEAVNISVSISDENNQHELSHCAGSTTSPNAPTPTPPLKCGHLILHGQPPM